MRPEEVSILVVDEVQAVRVQIKELLHECGFSNVKLAQHGAMALTMLEEQNIHLVLADWQMSPVDGIELLKHLRNSEKFKSMPYILVTGETTKEKVVEAIRSGIDDYIVKPLTPDHIRTKVFALLLKKQVI